jgi:ribosomal protein S1
MAAWYEPSSEESIRLTRTGEVVLKTGEIVRGTVTRTEVYGIYLSCWGHEILVLIPDVAWVPVVPDCRNFAEIGDEFDVKVLLCNEESGVYRGSIKDTHPEADPCREPAEFRPGTIWSGTVTHRISASGPDAGLFGYIVQLRPGVSGLLRI